MSGGHITDIGDEIKKLSSSHDVFLTALKRTKEIARPHAVKDIIALIR